MNTHSHLVTVLAKSKVVHDFQQAFTESTGLPISFTPAESWQLPLKGRKNESDFCAIMARQSHSCAHCLQVCHRLTEDGSTAPATVECGAGISETAVPVRTGDKLIGFLRTGQVFQEKPSPAQFDRAAKLAGALGVNADVEELRNAYFGTQVLSGGQYIAAVQLLSIFAEQLGLLAGQMLEQERLAEPPVITRAKQFINDNYAEDLSLPDVAKACHMSTYYFCKIFKRATGMNFTQHVCNVRIEKAKNLLLNPQLNVSEIAYEVGFQSLTHFNRVFKKMLGESPTQYRSRFPSGAA